MTEFFQNWESVARTLAALLVSGLIGLGVHFLVFSLIQRLARRTPSPVADAFVKHCRGPWKFLFPLFALSLFLPVLSLPDDLFSSLRHLISVAVIVSVTWLLIRSTQALEDVLLDRFPMDERDNLRARKFHTQLQVLRKTVVFVLVILAFAAVLMTFEKVRQLGTAILASAAGSASTYWTRPISLITISLPLGPGTNRTRALWRMLKAAISARIISGSARQGMLCLCSWCSISKMGARLRSAISSPGWTAAFTSTPSPA